MQSRGGATRTANEVQQIRDGATKTANEVQRTTRKRGVESDGGEGMRRGKESPFPPRAQPKDCLRARRLVVGRTGAADDPWPRRRFMGRPRQHMRENLVTMMARSAMQTRPYRWRVPAAGRAGIPVCCIRAHPPPCPIRTLRRHWTDPGPPASSRTGTARARATRRERLTRYSMEDGAGCSRVSLGPWPLLTRLLRLPSATPAPRHHPKGTRLDGFLRFTDLVTRVAA